MQIKARNLEGLLLDWAVAQVEKIQLTQARDFGIGRHGCLVKTPGMPYQPTQDWSIAGPIIARVGIDLRQCMQAPYKTLDARHFIPDSDDKLVYLEAFGREMVCRPNPPHPFDGKWLAQMSEGTGSTKIWRKEDYQSDHPLTAAMRCYVAHALGPVVEIPDALLDAMK